jgi:hypothetical protein
MGLRTVIYMGRPLKMTAGSSGLVGMGGRSSRSVKSSPVLSFTSLTMSSGFFSSAALASASAWALIRAFFSSRASLESQNRLW